MTEEQLAAEIHDLWRHWMLHLFNRADFDGRGIVALSVGDSARWWRQAHLAFDELTADEQESDRVLARALLEKMNAVLPLETP